VQILSRETDRPPRPDATSNLPFVLAVMDRLLLAESLFLTLAFGSSSPCQKPAVHDLEDRRNGRISRALGYAMEMAGWAKF
jgi:hypothetical protein